MNEQIAKPNIAQNISELIGNTPLLKLSKSVPEGSAEILAKIESYNPGGSIKDRIALGMIVQAEAQGKLKPGATLIEPTSGNTGIGLAVLSASRGYKLILVVPDDLSVERRRLLLWFGTELVFTPANLGMEECVRVAGELMKKYSDAYMLQQFDNPANPKIHYETTGPEIWHACGGKIDALVVGVGTGGTISGCGKFLKEKNPNIKIVAVEPTNSAVLSGGTAGFHRIAGIGAGFASNILNRNVIDQIIQVSDNDAFLYANKLGRKEGLSVGISSGAIACAAFQVAKELGKEKRLVCVFPDSWERYTSLEKFFTS